jgi:hypothetical protein
MKRRRIAATAATAALAVASPATAAKTGHVRAPVGGKARVSSVAAAGNDRALQSLDALRSAELRDHRHRLAAALAAELPSAAEPEVERGLAVADDGSVDLGTAIAHTTGASEEQVEAAFESMAQRALVRRIRGE